jgi:hypothetical protein
MDFELMARLLSVRMSIREVVGAGTPFSTSVSVPSRHADGRWVDVENA